MQKVLHASVLCQCLMNPVVPKHARENIKAGSRWFASCNKFLSTNGGEFIAAIKGNRFRPGYYFLFSDFAADFTLVSSTDCITFSLRLSLNFTILCKSSGSAVAIICAARMPAFCAAFKATVATGTPLGICKMERMESQPSMLLDDLTGTPITGNGVSEAVIPGRC